MSKPVDDYVRSETIRQRIDAEFAPPEQPERKPPPAVSETEHSTRVKMDTYERERRMPIVAPLRLAPATPLPPNNNFGVNAHDARQGTDILLAHPFVAACRVLGNNLLITRPQRPLIRSITLSHTGRLYLPGQTMRMMNEYGLVCSVLKCGPEIYDIAPYDLVVCPACSGRVVPLDHVQNIEIDVWFVSGSEIIATLELEPSDKEYQHAQAPPVAEESSHRQEAEATQARQVSNATK